MIKENFLHFIWRLQYFNKQDLYTTRGEQIIILSPGTLNTDAGPDFSNARIKIGDIEWYGNVEIHVQSSDWPLHNHHNDEAYDNIILHVVYTDNEPVRREDDQLIPTLVMKGRIDERLILKYTAVATSTSNIPCQANFESVSPLIKSSMIEKAVTERLIEKSDRVLEMLQRNKGDWQETSYQWLSINFGFKLNAEPFQRLAKSLPLKILLKHGNNQNQIEALLFGQAGFLEGKHENEYQQQLQKEYEFLRKKYSLEPIKKHEWKFLRIRPANFPTIRISQLAAVIFQIPQVITSFNEFNVVKEVYNKLSSVKTSSYWECHYQFGDSENWKSSGKLGKSSIDNIIINTIAVISFAMGVEKDCDEWKEKSISLLETVTNESNKILREWEQIGFNPTTAYESQGALQLYNNYCKNKRCLNCEIGASIFKVDSFALKSSL